MTGNSLNTAARLGFLDVTLGGATTTMAAQFDLDLRDPGVGGNADGRVTTSEMFSASVGSLIGTVVTANSGPCGMCLWCRND